MSWAGRTEYAGHKSRLREERPYAYEQWKAWRRRAIAGWLVASVFALLLWLRK